MTIRLLTLVVGIGLMTRSSGQDVPVVSTIGHPFSADEVTERVPSPQARNVLPLQKRHVYRDSAGRTRIDVPVPSTSADVTLVNINDPVAGARYFLDIKKSGLAIDYPSF